ncbi:PREDICTED: sodium channel and clathrin linker 1-like, partial [Galeopterus variegatus]|uniref:Sodium channel and clathrin linker 1-like n=1 Tax=Galeopterus variegatus TaxID=482537 RepID=A0ABM0SEB5_GALVR
MHWRRSAHDLCGSRSSPGGHLSGQCALSQGKDGVWRWRGLPAQSCAGAVWHVVSAGLVPLQGGASLVGMQSARLRRWAGYGTARRRCRERNTDVEHHLEGSQARPALRLHSELKDADEKPLEALPFGTEIGNDIYTDDETVRNLQKQLQLANQEKVQAVELWQTVSQELDRLQKLYQEHMTEAQIHVFESQKQKDQLTSCQQLTKQLHVTNENVEMTNQHFLKTITEQNVEIEHLRKQL